MFELTQLFIYRPIFMVQLLSAELLFAWSLKRKEKFGWRMAISLLVCFTATFIFPMLAYNAFYSSFMFFCFFAVTLFVLKFCFNATMKEIIFCAIAGYTVQHIAQELYELTNSIFNFSESINFAFYGSDTVDMDKFVENYFSVMLFFGLYFMAYVLLYVVVYFLFARQVRKYDIVHLNPGVMIAISAAIVFIDIIFSSIVTFSIPVENNLTAVVLLHLYNVACCILVMILLFEWPKRKQAEMELVVHRRLQEKERQQYSISKENIEQINMRCHDIKHQIRQMGEAGKIDAEFMEELEKSVDIYDSAYKTDNGALNVILSEKSIQCRKKGIELSCILDGGSLRFIKDSHIYSLFGNLLDNAIEAVSGLQNEDRAIGLVVKSQNGLLFVNIYNNYEGDVDFSDGIPKSTKTDGGLHGYGIKSIENIVRYYAGEMVINAENNVFEISIAIPHPADAE